MSLQLPPSSVPPEIPGPPYSDRFGFVRGSDPIPPDLLGFVNYLAEQRLKLVAARALIRADLDRCETHPHMGARRRFYRELLETTS